MSTWSTEQAGMLSVIQCAVQGYTQQCSASSAKCTCIHAKDSRWQLPLALNASRHLIQAGVLV